MSILPRAAGCDLRQGRELISTRVCMRVIGDCESRVLTYTIFAAVSNLDYSSANGILRQNL